MDKPTPNDRIAAAVFRIVTASQHAPATDKVADQIEAMADKAEKLIGSNS